jgi:hypothetical protein
MVRLGYWCSSIGLFAAFLSPTYVDLYGYVLGVLNRTTFRQE